MIYNLVTFAKVKLNPPSSITRSVIHRAMTRLNFVGDVGKLRGGLCLWGADQLVLWLFYNEFVITNLATFYLTHDHFKDMTQPILPFNFFIGKWPIWNLLMMSFTYTTLNGKKNSPYNTKLESRESFIMEPRSTPWLTSISNSMTLIRNCEHARASDAQTHQLGDSTKLEMSTLASSTLNGVV
jgi:hypothetical protein